ncbi:MAG: hypothetical protein FWD92_05895 [Methanomassiliicoccaceae archaeon]|nr:hypothetical protein [Methanomassiliicoccaceae archaeon]
MQIATDDEEQDFSVFKSYDGAIFEYRKKICALYGKCFSDETSAEK